MKKHRIKWGNLITLIVFTLSAGTLLIGGFWIALSTVCLTLEGTVLTLSLITIFGITGDHLYDEMH